MIGPPGVGTGSERSRESAANPARACDVRTERVRCPPLDRADMNAISRLARIVQLAAGVPPGASALRAPRGRRRCGAGVYRHPPSGPGRGRTDDGPCDPPQRVRAAPSRFTPNGSAQTPTGRLRRRLRGAHAWASARTRTDGRMPNGPRRKHNMRGSPSNASASGVHLLHISGPKMTEDGCILHQTARSIPGETVRLGRARTTAPAAPRAVSSREAAVGRDVGRARRSLPGTWVGRQPRASGSRSCIYVQDSRIGRRSSGPCSRLALTT